jgi:hypothetical protein
LLAVCHPLPCIGSRLLCVVIANALALNKVTISRINFAFRS